MPETQATSSKADILDRIVATKRREIEALEPRRDALARAAEAAPPPRDFESALRGGEHVSLIAEVKRRSPGAGDIRPDLDPAALASGYAAAGAAAVSVLTDGPWFGGALDDLRAVRRAVDLPLLRKDFTLAEVQVAEARAAGADAVLLIARILDDAAMLRLREAAEALGMAALVEVHGADELERALDAGARVLGINNRDLSTFTTRIDVTLELLDRVPRDVVVVSESGIRSAAEVERLGRDGVDAILVGETLLRADEPADAARVLAACPRSGRR